MLRHHRIVTSVVLFFLLSLVLTAYSVRNPAVGQLGSVFFQTLTVPFQRTFQVGWAQVSHFWSGYVWLIAAEDENTILKKEVLSLRSEVARLRELSQEAAALREILQLRTQTGYEGVVTSVIGEDPSGWVESVTIDRGRSDRIRARMPAILGGSVVGQVHASALRSAQVLLLTDRTSGVAGLVQRSRARGIVLGTGTDECTFAYVREEEDVLVGDIVVTSGLDGVFPKGLEIGRVVEVGESSGGMFREIRVAPSVDLKHLETLFVITGFEDSGEKGVPSQGSEEQ
ncbi:rod shape-determining protein MreC [bacterium]|nr:rod shape-determining protein MreC [bacterium]